MLVKAATIPILLLILLPTSSLQLTPPSTLVRLSALETSISTSWRINDHSTFQANVSEALATEIPKALFEITSTVTTSLGELFSNIPGRLKFLSPVFTITSVVADILSLTLFIEDNEFAQLYSYLEGQFIQVNAMIEENFHAIKDLESVLQCSQVSKEVMLRQNLVKGFFARYKEMLERGRTDRGEALAIFDTALPKLKSSRVLLELQHMLTDKSLYTKLLTYCARGDVMQYLKMMVELHHTFKQAIILDTAAKIRQFNLTKEALATDRQYWRDKSTVIVNLMTEVGTELVRKSWYTFYRADVDKSLSGTADKLPSDAAGALSSVLTAKYFYVRTAVIVVPSDHESIAITDAYGQDMKVVSADSFVCYRSRRAPRETVIVLCRNVFVYPDEQANLDSAFSTYSRGVLSLSLVDALRNDRWDDIGNMMKNYQVSFFAVRVVAKLNSGTVATAQSSAAVNLAFFQSEGTAFQALVIAKLVRGCPLAICKVVPPTTVTAVGVAVTARWPLVAAVTLSCFLLMNF